MRVSICCLLPLLCHCYLSSGDDGSDGAATDWADGASVDGGLGEREGGATDSLGLDGEGARPLRRTFLVLHDWVIEERRLDAPLEIVDVQDMPERLANSFSDEGHGQIVQLAATEHGFLFRYYTGLSRNIYVYDRRRGWSMHALPGDSPFISDQAIIRDGWLYPPSPTPEAGWSDSAQYAFHIETGRFQEIEMDPSFREMFDGLDGRVITTTTPARAWGVELIRATDGPGAMRPLQEGGGLFPVWPSGWGFTQASAFRDGTVPVYVGLDNSLSTPDRDRTWALVRQDADNVFRVVRRVQRHGSAGNIVATTDNTVLYFERRSRRGTWQNQNHEVTLYRMDANLENEEALLTERWYFPVEIALGDPVDRVVAALRDE